MDFYTSVEILGNSILISGYKNGKRLRRQVAYKPYLFLPSKSPNTTYKTLAGAGVEKHTFDTIREARTFFEEYKDVAGMNIYGYNKFVYPYIYDTFPGKIEFDQSLIKTAYIDIEVYSGNGFPHVETASEEITAIAVLVNDTVYSFGTGDFKPPKDAYPIIYKKCLHEVDLIQSFIDILRTTDPDIVSGWNIAFFDLPYLINRIRRLWDDNKIKELSPFKWMRTIKTTFRNKEMTTYEPVGLSILDYYDLYKKFTYEGLESYTLDFVSNKELNVGKFDYKEKYATIHDFYVGDYQNYMYYNALDVVRVKQLDDKKKFIRLAITMAYDAKVNYMDVLGSVKQWEVLCHNYLMDKKVVVPSSNNAVVRPFEGAYNKEPLVGFHKWVVSFDLSSLYPHLIIQYNIGPETRAGKINGVNITIDDILNGELKKLSADYIDKDLALASNLCLYRRDKQGFLAALMEEQFEQRKVYKKKMLEAESHYERTKDERFKQVASEYHSAQMAKKIQLNSLYGVVSNQHFLFYNADNAEAVTKSGQLSIRFIANKINAFLNKILKTDEIDYIVAIDTDSNYINLGTFVEQHCGGLSDQQIVDMLDKFCKKVLEPKIAVWYEELAKYVNAFKNAMAMKREIIADKAVWVGSKRYFINLLDAEGVRYSEPKLKMVGIEAIRSTTPSTAREKLKEALKLIIKGEESAVHSVVAGFRKEFFSMPFEKIASPVGINGLEKYGDSATIYKKGTPFHVKGALMYNKLLKDNKLTNRYQPISDKDKVKFCYLVEPNPTRGNVITSPSALPSELDLDRYIDYDRQFERVFLKPLGDILKVIGWGTKKKARLPI